jgi:hypothetical protein
MARDEPLKLLARDPEDMDVFAALLQDALVPLADVTFQKPAAPPPPEREGDARFEDGEAEPPYERVNCGLCIERVQNVRYKDMRPTAKDEILNLLTIKAEPRVITLLFSGGGAIRLEVSAIRARLEDLGEAWPTRWRPSHDEAEAEPGAAAAGRDEG